MDKFAHLHSTLVLLKGSGTGVDTQDKGVFTFYSSSIKGGEQISLFDFAN